jgi:hypothetical protein
MVAFSPMAGTASPTAWGPNDRMPVRSARPARSSAAPGTRAARVPRAASAANAAAVSGVQTMARSGAASSKAASWASMIGPAKWPARRLASTALPSADPAPITATERGRNRSSGRKRPEAGFTGMTCLDMMHRESIARRIPPP